MFSRLCGEWLAVCTVPVRHYRGHVDGVQPFAGSLSDRYGRRAVMIGCALCEAVAYGGLAFVHGFWPICVLMVIDRGIGWPLYLTASNAMTADLLRPHLRAEGYGLVRLMIGAGYVIGPALAAVVLALGAPLAALFLVAGAGCLLYLAFVVAGAQGDASAPHAVARRRRSSPRAPRRSACSACSPGPAACARASGGGRATGRGWGRVLADRRFLLFCLISLLPLFIFGQTYTTYPVLLTTYLTPARGHLGPARVGDRPGDGPRAVPGGARGAPP